MALAASFQQQLLTKMKGGEVGPLAARVEELYIASNRFVVSW